MRRERFADEAADVESTQAGSQDSVSSHGEMIIASCFMHHAFQCIDICIYSCRDRLGCLWTWARSVI